MRGMVSVFINQISYAYPPQCKSCSCQPFYDLYNLTPGCKYRWAVAFVDQSGTEFWSDSISLVVVLTKLHLKLQLRQFTNVEKY